MSRVFSGIQPTGDLHLGNFLGAIQTWVEDQHVSDSFYCIVDLHALTIPKAPGEVRAKTLELAQVLIACGVDPESCTLFVQSHVREHQPAGMADRVRHVAYGELRRMTQFKEKAARARSSSPPGCSPIRRSRPPTSCSTTPIEVPVGEDQRQHIELTRDVARAIQPPLRRDVRHSQCTSSPGPGPRVMDLQNPTNKMSQVRRRRRRDRLRERGPRGRSPRSSSGP